MMDYSIFFLKGNFFIILFFKSCNKEDSLHYNNTHKCEVL